MSIQFAYRIDEMPPEHHVTADPFQGRGVRLDLDGEHDPAEVCQLITDTLGLPCVADSHGAWADLAHTSENATDVQKVWAEKLALSSDLGEVGSWYSTVRFLPPS